MVAGHGSPPDEIAAAVGRAAADRLRDEWKAAHAQAMTALDAWTRQLERMTHGSTTTEASRGTTTRKAGEPVLQGDQPSVPQGGAGEAGGLREAPPDTEGQSPGSTWSVHSVTNGRPDPLAGAPGPAAVEALREQIENGTGEAVMLRLGEPVPWTESTFAEMARDTLTALDTTDFKMILDLLMTVASESAEMRAVRRWADVEAQRRGYADRLNAWRALGGDS